METVKTVKLNIGGMTCVSCQNKIEIKLRQTAGVLEAAVSYGKGTAVVTYDTEIVSLDEIKAIIRNPSRQNPGGRVERPHQRGHQEADGARAENGNRSRGRR